tara:strand:+ start:49346 stop:50053 length:708 start_codon:yes stop_codon:yes gene_type:complete
MTAIQLQRIIGVVLLFSLIVGIAILLIRSADDGVAIDNTEQTSKLGFEPHSASVVEPYVTEAIINPVSGEQHSSVVVPLEQAVIEQKPVSVAPVVVKPVTAKAVSVEPIAIKPVAPKPDPVKPVPVEPSVVKPKPVVAKPAPINVVASKPAAAAQIIPAEKWVVQLASFSVKANADALNLQAQQMGYKSVIENSDGENGKIYRVRLEPMADKQKAQTIADDLGKKLALATRVLQE